MGFFTRSSRRDENDLSPFGSRRPTPLVARMMRSAASQKDSWLGKRFAFLLRRQAIRLLDGPVDAEVIGVNMRLYPFHNVCERRLLFTPQYFDSRERALIVSMINPGVCFVDVGANVGGYALHVASLAGPDARILAVEPQPGIFERLVYNIEQNRFGTMKAIACAITDLDGEVTLFIDPQNRGQSSIKMVAVAEDETARVRVPSKTLLTLLREEKSDHVDVLKLDVVGAEDLILETFLPAAPKSLHPTMIIVERAEGRWHMNVKELLLRHGYRADLETRLNMVFRRDPVA